MFNVYNAYVTQTSQVSNGTQPNQLVEVVLFLHHATLRTISLLLCRIPLQFSSADHVLRWCLRPLHLPVAVTRLVLKWSRKKRRERVLRKAEIKKVFIVNQRWTVVKKNSDARCLTCKRRKKEIQEMMRIQQMIVTPQMILSWLLDLTTQTQATQSMQSGSLPKRSNMDLLCPLTKSEHVLWIAQQLRMLFLVEFQKIATKTRSSRPF